MSAPRIVLALLATSTAAACATDRQAPFHVYQSPLLAAERDNPRPVNRTFDPAEPGDWQLHERVVAQTEPQKPTRAPKARKKRPTLAVTGIGGHGEAVSSSAEHTDFAPPLAAAYVHRTFAVNGVDLGAVSQTSIPRLWDACKGRGRTHQQAPLPGDAAFFHNAFDANADGRNNDWYTHVAIVSAVDAAGTATLLSWRGGRVVELRVNPGRPDDPEVNSRLRAPSPDDPPFTQYHAGQLLAGWCTALDGKRDVIVMDAWVPDVR